MHNVQIIANDFNGSNSLFSQIICNCYCKFVKFSLVRFYGLVYPQSFWYCNNFLVIDQELFS